MLAFRLHHEKGHAAVSTDFASACAQLLPIFGLAAIAELLLFSRQIGGWFSNRREWRNPSYWGFLILPGFIAYALWAWMIFRIAGDEGACLEALQGTHFPPGAAGSVELTIDKAIALLIVLPVIGAPLFGILRLAGDRTDAKASKREPAYLDDEVQLCMDFETDYRPIPSKQPTRESKQSGETRRRFRRESKEPSAESQEACQ
jgi:hypothetical protein